MPRSTLPWLPLFAALALAAGCDKEEINTFDVPKPPPVSVPEGKVRLLAAVFDVKEADQWYFKLVGPKDDVAKQADAFDKFIDSVKFLEKGEKPVEWSVPEGWERGEGGEKLRFATLYPAGKASGLALTVFHFDQRSPLLDNVNRWCDRDLGRSHFRKGDLDPDDEKNLFVRRLPDAAKQGAKSGVRVSIEGPGPRAKDVAHAKGKVKGDDKPFPIDLGPKQPPVKPGKAPFTFKTPPGWTETGPRGGFVPIDMAFAVKEGDAAAEVTVLSMQTTVADKGNVDRWRGQVGLGPLSADEVAKLAPREVKVGGTASKLYEFIGKDRGMLLILVQRGRATWFVKLMGAAAAVEKNRDKFTAFAQSIEFTGAER